LIIRDIPSVIPVIDNLLHQLDRKSQQVEIEARVWLLRARSRKTSARNSVLARLRPVDGQFSAVTLRLDKPI